MTSRALGTSCERALAGAASTPRSFADAGRGGAPFPPGPAAPWGGGGGGGPAPPPGGCGAGGGGAPPPPQPRRAGTLGAVEALNFYNPLVADQLRSRRKTVTIRLGDKSAKYR